MATYVFDGTSNQTTQQFNLDEDQIVLDLASTDLARVEQTGEGVVFTTKNGTTFVLAGLALADLSILQGNGGILSTELSFDFGADGADGLTLTTIGGVAVGANGADNIVGSIDADLILGNQSDDIIDGSGGSDTIYGGQGDDDITLGFTSTDDTPIVLAGLGDDTVDASAADESVTIYGGNGQLDASDGADLITGGTAADLIFGNAGEDTINGGTDDTIYGGQGNDTVTISALGAATDSSTLVYGGLGSDSIIADAAAGDMTVYGGNGAVDSADGADTIFTGGGDDLVYGNAGDDFIISTGGLDTIFGGQGDDYVGGDFEAGSVFYGGLGADQFEVTISAAGDTATSIFGGNGVADAADEEDHLHVYGDADVTVYGNGGDDELLNDGTGQATLYGGQGDDTISGGDETGDIVFGGQGADLFIASGFTLASTEATTIADFDQGTDLIEFGGIDVTTAATVLLGDSDTVDDISDLSGRGDVGALADGEVLAFRVADGDLAGSTVVFSDNEVVVLTGYNDVLTLQDFA